MNLYLFRQDIKKIYLLVAFQQSLSSGQKTADFRRYWQIFVKIAKIATSSQAI